MIEEHDRQPPLKETSMDTLSQVITNINYIIKPTKSITDINQWMCAAVVVVIEDFEMYRF